MGSIATRAGHCPPQWGGGAAREDSQSDAGAGLDLCFWSVKTTLEEKS